MPRPLSVVVLLALAVPTGALAQDFCSALETTRNNVLAARNAVSSAAADVETLRFRINEDPRRYQNQVEALTEPQENTAAAKALMEAAVRNVSELQAASCPNIPDGR